MKKICFASVLVLALVGCGNSDNRQPSSASADKKESSIESKTGKWRIVISKDEMRKTESKWPSLRSDNNADLKFPYDGENRLTIDILDSKTDEPRIFLTIDSGQYDCNEYCYTAVKFGNSPIQYVNFQKYETSGGDGTILIFTENSKAFLENIRKFNSIIIELPFYSNGTRQFKFDTSKFNEAEKEI
ncbi:hypothetical protein [Acinetobacter pittii]|uniref:hypothetical protein n=1 Tax=Acinetobacter pittii TaxID=48296 RepID=UPI000F7412B8|nr:hypothetical protein [Acinetobacter pittii]MDX8157837.1 hypothetical protein [Acinetobacter pittii]RSO48405.1 hypothetical protein EA757_06895 [Acinetobacter pittii]RSO77795.1 hypothetical protein EA753_07805 [Acinetobacter pittii]